MTMFLRQGTFSGTGILWWAVQFSSRLSLAGSEPFPLKGILFLSFAIAIRLYGLQRKSNGCHNPKGTGGLPKKTIRPPSAAMRRPPSATPPAPRPPLDGAIAASGIRGSGQALPGNEAFPELLGPVFALERRLRPTRSSAVAARS